MNKGIREIIASVGAANQNNCFNLQGALLYFQQEPHNFAIVQGVDSTEKCSIYSSMRTNAPQGKKMLNPTIPAPCNNSKISLSLPASK